MLSIANVAGKAMDDGKTLDGRAGIEVCFEIFTCWHSTEHNVTYIYMCVVSNTCTMHVLVMSIIAKKSVQCR